MHVQVLCPNPGCGASYNVEDRRLGRESRCVRCGRRFPLVPETRPDGSTTLPFDEAPPTTELEGPGDAPSGFGRYRVVRRIGRGGMGTVYLAEDTQLDRRVALKVPHPAYRDAPGARERFLREARAAARFRHPNFCPIHDIGEVDGVPYLTMAFLEGRTLASLIEPGRPWPGRRAAEVARKLAGALAEAHRRGVVHRDLKPANVMVEGDGDLVLMDFGLARRIDATDPTSTVDGLILGTPAYMPPEQAEGDHDAVGPRSDIYSLGVILYELLAGRRPFEGSAARVLGQVAAGDPPRPSALHRATDPRLEAICLRAMARHPEDRYPSMDELAGALDDWLATDAEASGGPPRPVEGDARSHRRPRGFRLSIHVWGFKLTVAVVGSVMLMATGYLVVSRTRMAAPSTEVGSVAVLDRAPAPRAAPPPPRPSAPRPPGLPIDMRLAKIPPGEITRRARPDRGGRGGTVTVQVRSFRIGTREVTRSEYRAVTGEDPSSLPGQPDHPVESVSWLDAAAFCNRLTELEGSRPYYDLDRGTAEARPLGTDGYRLPTEDEWEYACNGRPGTVGFADLDYPESVGGFAWYAGNSESTTHPVGLLRPNGFGLFDMRGNVEEWCSDNSGGPADRGGERPRGPQDLRIVRGGSWASELVDVVTPARSARPPGHEDRTIGFRVARDLP